MAPDEVLSIGSQSPAEKSYASHERARCVTDISIIVNDFLSKLIFGITKNVFGFVFCFLHHQNLFTVDNQSRRFES